MLRLPTSKKWSNKRGDYLETSGLTQPIILRGQPISRQEQLTKLRLPTSIKIV